MRSRGSKGSKGIRRTKGIKTDGGQRLNLIAGFRGSKREKIGKGEWTSMGSSALWGYMESMGLNGIKIIEGIKWEG